MDMQRAIGLVVGIAGLLLLVVPKFLWPQMGGWHFAVAIGALAAGLLMVIQSVEIKNR